MANLTKPLPLAAAICALLGGPVLVAQRARPPQPRRPPERYQAALTRLAAMTGINVTKLGARTPPIFRTVKIRLSTIRNGPPSLSPADAGMPAAPRRSQATDTPGIARRSR